MGRDGRRLDLDQPTSVPAWSVTFAVSRQLRPLVVHAVKDLAFLSAHLDLSSDADPEITLTVRARTADEAVDYARQRTALALVHDEIASRCAATATPAPAGTLILADVRPAPSRAAEAQIDTVQKPCHPAAAPTSLAANARTT